MTVSFTRNNKRANVSATTWNLTNADATGKAISSPLAADRSVQVTGTFDAGTVTIQGSNEEIPLNWNTLRAADSTDLLFTVAGLKAITENPLWIRAIMTGHGGTANVNVNLVAKGH